MGAGAFAAGGEDGQGGGLAGRSPTGASGCPPSPPQPASSQEDLWLLRGKRPLTRSQIQEGEEDQELDLELDWAWEFPSPSPKLSLDMPPERPLLPEMRPSLPSKASMSVAEREARGPKLSRAPAPLSAIVAQRLEALAKRRSREATARTETSLRRHRFHREHSLWEMRYGHLPRFLRFFAIQNWFKKLFPLFTLEVRGGVGRGREEGVQRERRCPPPGWESWLGEREKGLAGAGPHGWLACPRGQAYPELGTVDGLAWWFMDLLKEVSWEDRAHILRALLRLLPEMNKTLYKRLQKILIHLLNLDPPPSLQVRPGRPAPTHPPPPRGV